MFVGFEFIMRKLWSDVVQSSNGFWYDSYHRIYALKAVICQPSCSRA